ncbi:hypothetical protein P0136_06550 [Lentisphaerota bacterium ZTH]|nr:hypothetical protein JYG24_02340 [Lentisphaerota bacterium]WET07649.1 hypothetical protein P0136_06550 [Lentisphaerota bacterium ZTH]
MGKDFIATGIISAVLLLSMLPSANTGGRLCCDAAATRLALLQISRYHAELNSGGAEINDTTDDDNSVSPVQTPVINDLNNISFIKKPHLPERIKLRELQYKQPCSSMQGISSEEKHSFDIRFFHISKFAPCKNNSYIVKHFQTALL